LEKAWRENGKTFFRGWRRIRRVMERRTRVWENREKDSGVE
jgi:hypothetical protein